ncbi:MAG: magnesium transporter [Bradymonadia bacterium]|jgi:magnesium transporter
MALGPRLQLLHDSLRKLLRRNAYSHAERLLKKSRPADVAVVMRFLSEVQQNRVFDMMPDDDARAELLSEMDDRISGDLLESRPLDEVLRLLNLMSPDDLADLLASLSDEQRAQLIDALNPSDAEEVEELLHYGEETAGGIMSPDFFALPQATTAAEAIKALQADEDAEMAFYIYVVNEPGHLVGVVSLRQLVTTPPTTPLRELMATDIISVDLNDDQEYVAAMAARYNLLAIPVVDESNHLEGIVTIDDVIDVIRDEATEDILKMAGAGEDAFDETSVLRSVRTRAPWLLAAWFGGLAASMLIGAYEEQIATQVVLAAFIPVILGMGGNVGTQTATVMVRGLATGRVTSGSGWHYFVRETSIGVVLGIIYGMLLAVYTAVWHADEPEYWGLAATVGISISASMAIAAMVGACIPLVLDRLKFDPAVATGPFVTTAVDVLGILGYFTVAGFFLDSI